MISGPDRRAEIDHDKGVSPQTASAPHDAMSRLLAGRPQRTDGWLVKDNLWKEAGLSRAIMNRASLVMAEWDARVADCGGLTPGEARRSDELSQSRGKLAGKTRECTQLHHQLDAAATTIAALHHDNTLLRQELDHEGQLVSIDAPQPAPNWRQPLTCPEHPAPPPPPTDCATAVSEEWVLDWLTTKPIQQSVTLSQVLTTVIGPAQSSWHGRQELSWGATGVHSVHTESEVSALIASLPASRIRGRRGWLVGRTGHGARSGAWRLAVFGFVTTLLAPLVCATGAPSASAAPPRPPRRIVSLLPSSAVARRVVTPSGRYAADQVRRVKPTPVQEVMADRTASTSTWRNSDGSLSVRRYLTPHFYKTAAGTWSSIDPSLSPVTAQPGWWRSGANNWSVSFGPAGVQGGAVRFTVGAHTFGLAPQTVTNAGQSPSVSGSSATYQGIWTGVDLAEHVSGTGVKEDLVVRGPGAASSFSFRLSGATAVPNNGGGLDVVAGGAKVGTLPAPTVTVASAKSSLDQTKASKVRMAVTGDVVQLSVSPDWLAGLPASAFPVVIDPSFFTLSPSSSWQMSSVSDGGQVLNGVVQVGQDGAGSNWRAEVNVPAPAAPSASPGQQPWQFAGVLMYLPSDSQLTDVPAYGLSGSSSFSDIPGGTPLQGVVTAGQSASYAGLVVGLSGDSGSYITSRSSDWWFGLGTPGQVAGPNGGHLATFNPSASVFEVTYDQQPNPTTITSPANTSVLSTTTPTLTADHLPADSSGEDLNNYDFKISTSPDGTGTVIDSGWLMNSNFWNPAAITWTVPPGSLHDGATYYVKVLTSEWVLYSSDPQFTGSIKPTSSPTISFVVKERLGDGGPSPTDTVGSPPAGTTVPSKGAPSPGVPIASETVNQVNGNLAVTVGTPSMQTVSGSAGLALSYNSAQSSVSKGGNYGLTGQYYADGGAHTFTSPLAGQRTDAAVNATWESGNAPIGTLRATNSTGDSPFMVRWTGVLTLPAGTWQLGGSTTGGLRVSLNGSTTPTYDDWAGTAGSTSPSYGSATLNGSQTYQIEVDSWALGKVGKTDTAQLWAKNTAITDPNAVNQWVVPSGWLTPTGTGVPPGWFLLANPATAQWIHADDEGGQVIVQGASGETASFTREAPGYYQSQPGNTDHLGVDGNGRLQLATSDNQLYGFNPDGSLASMTSATDDRHPAALQYTYTGTPALLRSITDPVSGRALSLSYGGDTACSATNPAPAGMLCKISYWDGTATTFGYNGNGQIASVIDALGKTVLLAYDSDNRLADVRDPLAGDYVTAGGQAGTPVDCPTGTTGLSVTPVDTQICYDSSGRVATVTQPAPTSGAARPVRTYTYATGHTDTAIAGFQPTSGYASRTAYDAQGRIIQQNDSTGRTTTTVWANATAPGQDCASMCGSDQPVVTVTPDGEQTSTMYDANGDATDVYGPAPLACFSGGWPTGATPTAPAQGYLPVSNPQATAGCGIATVPHTHNGYDEGMSGLAASFWSNGQAAGSAAMHTTGPGGTQPQSLCGATSGRLCAHWAAGAPPIGSDASGHWSLRLTGTITLASAGPYTFGTASSQAVTVSVDGTPRVHDGSDVSGFVAGQTRSTSGSAVQFAAGVHTVQVDFQGSATQPDEFAVSLTPTGGSGAVISTTILGPRYRLKTSTTDQDGIVTTTSYSDANIGPEYGLATATTVGAGTGAALTTSTSYEAPGTSTYLRKTGHTLPAGNATTYSYYTGTDGPLAAVCGVAAATAQGGQLQSQIDAAPASGAAAREQQFVYDAAGRRAGRRIGSSTSISSAPWQCTSYDASGRTVSQSWPAFNGAAARTVTYTYAVGGNPLVSSVADPTGTITTTVDLLGRLVSYTDTNGKTSTVTYNQAGQLTATSGPQGPISNTYDPDSGSLATVTAGGTLLATTHYDTGSGRLTSVIYTNGTTGTLGYDALGTQNSLVFTTTASGGLVAGDQTTLSPARRVTGELEDINGTALTNPNPAGSTATTYTYDGAGRLATAYLPGASATYGYATNPAGDNCANPNQGTNTDRTQVTTTPTGGTAASTDYCYNGADQLVSSTTTGAGTNTQYGYDTHGNQTNDHGTTVTWDGADRLASATPSGGTATSYSYDALDRAVSHTTGTSTVRYAYAAYVDSPVAVLDGSNNVLQQLVSLPGGVLATIQTSGTVWSYPNLRGNMTVTTTNTGSRLSGPVTYDPWGQPTSGSQTLNNAAGGNTFATYGANAKLTDSTLGITVLGARAYLAAEGRFLSVDPIEGGCANNYVYVFGDPLNKNDLTGQFGCTTTFDKHQHSSNPYYIGAFAGEGLALGTFGVGAGHRVIYGRGAPIRWGAGGAAGGLGSFLGDAMGQLAATGKVNWCSAGEAGAFGFAVGALFALL